MLFQSFAQVMMTRGLSTPRQRAPRGGMMIGGDAISLASLTQ